MPLYELIKILK